jgi:hypothetical protein
VADDAHAVSPAGKRPWRVKHDGTCSRCGLLLRKGDVAVWERSTKSIRCVECPTADGSLTPASEPTPDIEPGVAGASGRREYVRRRGRREARVLERFGRRLGGVLLKVSGEPQSTRAWKRGAEGEEKLAASLADLDGVRVLHDRAVRGTTGNIDHLVIAPAGVFVVDAKNYRGRIRIRDKGGLLRSDRRLYVGGRDCSKLADGLRWQVEAVTSALLGAGLDPLPSVTPVLCFVDGDWPLLFPPSEYNGVRLEGVRSLRKLLTARAALDQAAIDALARTLGAVFSPK